MPYKILLEGCQLMLSQRTGIATYGRNLANALSANGYETDLLIDTDKTLRETDPTLNAISLFDAVRPIPWGPLKRRLRRAFGAPFGIEAVKVSLDGVVADFVAKSFCGFAGIWMATDLDQLSRHHFVRHGKRAKIKLRATPAVFHTTQPIALRVEGCPNVYTIHDLVPLKLPHTTRDQKPYVLNMMRELCRTADHIVTVSEFSRREIIKFFGISEDRVTNTYQAVSLPEEPSSCGKDQIASILENAFELDYGKYFLFVGAIEPKKNLSQLIDAYAVSGSNHPLIIVGGFGWQHEQELAKIGDERFLRYEIARNTVTPRRQVRHLSYVSAQHLVALMRGARALLFPSLYEGFGLPVLEAMSLGTPVMTSNVASLPEVAGEAAIFADPLNVDDMARAIRALDCDNDLRDQLRARGPRQAALFSPENYQKRLAELYKRILA